MSKVRFIRSYDSPFWVDENYYHFGGGEIDDEIEMEISDERLAAYRSRLDIAHEVAVEMETLIRVERQRLRHEAHLELLKTLGPAQPRGGPVPKPDRAMGVAKCNELMKQWVMPLTLGDPPRALVTEEFFKISTEPEKKDDGTD